MAERSHDETPAEPKTVVVLDYGSGNLRSAERAVARTGVDVTVTSDLRQAAACGLISVLPRQGCDYGEIVRAIQHLHQGRVELPGAEFRSLLARSRPLTTK